LCLGRAVVDRWGWTAFSICEDWEMYVLLTERGVPVRNVPAARVFAQEARSLKQSASQRRRWAAGKITVVRDRLPSLLRSARASWRQKLDVVAELTSVGPAVQAGIVALLVAIVLLLDLPGAPWLAGALVLSLARLAAYTLLAIAADPEPVRTALAFAYLPFYTLWRLVVQLGALRMLGDKPWVRTERHVAADGDPPTSTPARSSSW
jgi:cellulose synthase/poly-beta-1,6-N-acetylglucosamine synthase-like glycosyltransferase